MKTHFDTLVHSQSSCDTEDLQTGGVTTNIYSGG